MNSDGLGHRYNICIRCLPWPWPSVNDKYIIEYIHRIYRYIDGFFYIGLCNCWLSPVK